MLHMKQRVSFMSLPPVGKYTEMLHMYSYKWLWLLKCKMYANLLQLYNSCLLVIGHKCQVNKSIWFLQSITTSLLWTTFTWKFHNYTTSFTKIIGYIYGSQIYLALIISLQRLTPLMQLLGTTAPSSYFKRLPVHSSRCGNVYPCCWALQRHSLELSLNCSTLATKANQRLVLHIPVLLI